MRVQMCVKGSLWKVSRQRGGLCQFSVSCPSNPNSSFIIWYAKMKPVHLNIFLCQLTMLNFVSRGQWRDIAGERRKTWSDVFLLIGFLQCRRLFQHLPCRQLLQCLAPAVQTASPIPDSSCWLLQYPASRSTSAWRLSLVSFSDSYIVKCLQ